MYAFLNSNYQQGVESSAKDTNLTSMKSVTIAQKIMSEQVLDFYKKRFPNVPIRTCYFEKVAAALSGLGLIDIEDKLPIGQSYPITPCTGFSPQIRNNIEQKLNVNEEGNFCFEKGGGPLGNMRFFTIGNVQQDTPPNR